MIIQRTPLALLPFIALGACTPEATNTPDPSLPILGGEAHDLSTMLVEELLTADDGLNNPQDLALHPENRSELWVANRGDDSMLITFALGTENQTSSRRAAPGNFHFMPQPSAFAFGDAGTMATAHFEDEITQSTTPADFMGPTLWSSDETEFDGGHPSHLDMLHNSPFSVGIAWEVGNAFWVFDGFHSAITRYDFVEDHGFGQDDHSDGIVERMVEGQVLAVDDVPAHMELDHATNTLYIADTGNHRIAALDITSGTLGARINPNYDGTKQNVRDGGVITSFAENDDEEIFLQQPSGLALHDGMVFISDFKSGEVQAFSMDGKPQGYLKTGLEESITGIEFDDDGRLLVIDSLGDRVLRLSPAE